MVVEQNATRGSDRDRGYVLELGRTASRAGQRLLADPEVKRLYLGGDYLVELRDSNLTDPRISAISRRRACPYRLASADMTKTKGRSSRRPSGAQDGRRAVLYHSRTAGLDNLTLDGRQRLLRPS